MSSVTRPARPLPEADRPPRLELISDYARHWATATPDADAVLFQGIRWTFPEFADRVDQCAKALLAAGVRRGDRVATLSPPHPDYYVIFLATASIGAIWVGLNPRYQRRELKYVLDDAKPSVVLARQQVGDRDFRADLDAMAAAHRDIRQWVRLDAASDHPDSLARFLAEGATVSDAELTESRQAVSTGDPCLIVYTSGTTGQPKGAL
ncbi:MAG: AMP-binding protein, partial [Gemmatimonadales bacterium]